MILCSKLQDCILKPDLENSDLCIFVINSIIFQERLKGCGFDSRLGDRIQDGDYERIDTDPGCILDLMEEKVANVENCKILCLNEVDKLLSHEKV